MLYVRESPEAIQNLSKVAMTVSHKDTLLVVLLCIVCVLGTYVYLSQPNAGCHCDNATVISKLDLINSKISGTHRVGTPVGSPLGSPAGSP